MTTYEQLARRYCALLGEDPDERIDGVAIWRIALGDLEAAMNALDTFDMDVRSTFHAISEANDTPEDRPRPFRLRRVA
jgi:hypothetical protein